MTHKIQSRAQFATRLGVIATTVGSAVGLGNIWRFPYEAGAHGGGAFLICYIAFILLLGVPVICAEFMMGRATQRNIFGAFRKLKASGKWHLVGYIGITASLMILSFYSVVAGWTLEYIVQSITGGLKLATQEEYHVKFSEFSTVSWRPLMWTLLFLAINYVIIRRGVRKGIERASNILMPLLFLILIVFCINSLSMPKAKEGLQFLFMPDWSQINSTVVLGAMGQAFFSLSLGLGCMLTYASYFNEKTPIVKSAVTTACLDTFVAILAGVLIFPAVFTFGASPAEGPTLVFEILPTIFHQLPYGELWSTLFFVMLFLASLTSTISMSEISIAFFTEELKLSRKGACNLNTLIAVVFGTLCALSFSVLGDIDVFGMFKLNFFQFFNDCSSNVLLPLGGLLISVFVGWVLGRKFIEKELTNNYTKKAPVTIIVLCLKFVAPIGIMLIFLMSLGLI
jgi:NSS family neurotransmitter:Na+ symporter